MSIDDLYYQAIEVEAAWMAELRLAFPGQRAGDVRYTKAAEGSPGSALRLAFDAYVKASDELNAALTT